MSAKTARKADQPTIASKPSTPLYEDGRNWKASAAKDWKAWLAEVPKHDVDLTTGLRDQLIRAIGDENLEDILKWTRILAAELLGQGRSPIELWQKAQIEFVPDKAEAGGVVMAGGGGKERVKKVMFPT